MKKQVTNPKKIRVQQSRAVQAAERATAVRPGTARKSAAAARILEKELPSGKAFGKIGLFGAGIDLGLNTYFNIKNGDSVGTALFKGVGEAAAWAVAPGLMGTAMVAGMVPAMMVGADRANQMLGQKYRQGVTPGANFTYKDTRQAMTMRQAGVQAIQGSKMNARNALGGEASLMHRGYTR